MDTTLCQHQKELLTYIESAIKDKLQGLLSVADYLRMIERLGLFKESGTFEQYCMKWGLNEDRIEAIVYTQEVFDDLNRVVDASLFNTPDLIKPFVYMDPDDRKKLALWVIGRHEPITPELIEVTRAKIFPIIELNERE